MFVSIPKAPYFVVKFTDVMSDLKLEKMWRKEILVSVPECRGSVRAAEPGRDIFNGPASLLEGILSVQWWPRSTLGHRDDQVVTSSTPIQLLRCSDRFQNWTYEKLPPNDDQSGCFSSLSLLSIRNKSANMLNYNYTICEFCSKRGRKFYNVIFTYVCMYICMYVVC